MIAYVPDALDGNDDAIIELAADADVLIRGTPFVRSESAVAEAFGHGTAEAAANIARRAGVRQLVLTHHARPSIAMQGGTTFHFVTDGIEAALTRAKEAAQGRDVRLGGGVATIRQYLRVGHIDEMHLAMSPVLLGSGENLFADIDLPKLGFERSEHVATANATHIVLTKRS